VTPHPVERLLRLTQLPLLVLSTAMFAAMFVGLKLDVDPRATQILGGLWLGTAGVAFGLGRGLPALVFGRAPASGLLASLIAAETGERPYSTGFSARAVGCVFSLAGISLLFFGGMLGLSGALALLR
jgi:hypothetical protein